MDAIFLRDSWKICKRTRLPIPMHYFKRKQCLWATHRVFTSSVSPVVHFSVFIFSLKNQVQRMYTLLGCKRFTKMFTFGQDVCKKRLKWKCNSGLRYYRTFPFFVVHFVVDCRHYDCQVITFCYLYLFKLFNPTSKYLLRWTILCVV